MAFWWVSQNRTFEEEHAGGYLWAPNRDKGGKTPHHWRTMGELQTGDSIFCYVDQAIVAIAIVDRAPYSASRPFSLVGADVWQNDGQRADVTYEFLDEPLDIRKVKSGLIPLLPKVYSPLTASGGGVQGYLFRLPNHAAEYLLGHITNDKPTVEPVEKSRSINDWRDLWLGRKPKSARGDSLPRGTARRSPRARIIGDRAEVAVLDFLRQTLPSEHSATLCHVSAEGRQPGWDIEYSVNGQCIAVEVKGSGLDQFGAVEISANEWSAAERLREMYRLALVTNAEGATPRIAFVDDPFGRLAKGELSAQPAMWRIERIEGADS